MSNNQRHRMVGLVKKFHDGQYRNAERKTPYWMHCTATAGLVEAAYRQSGIDMPESVYLAALAHDLYEDTDISPVMITQEFGHDVHELVQALTNEQDDSHRNEYMQKLRTASEEVRLIKLADMTDNIMSVMYNLDVLGLEWLEQFFLPIMRDTITTLSETSFTHLSEPARLLTSMRDLAFELLLAQQQSFVDVTE